MIQQYDNMNELENELIEEIVTLLNHSIKTKGEATLLLSGGNTPKNLYQKLSLQNIEWDKVNVGLVDERFVEKESPLCNEKMIRDTLIQNQASKARIKTFYKSTIRLTTSTSSCRIVAASKTC